MTWKQANERKEATRQSLVGQRFGLLTVIAPRGKTPAFKRIWLCRCSCGTEKEIIGGNLRSGGSASCGCVPKQKASARAKSLVKHGAIDTPEYRSWTAMKSRCGNPNATGFARYGGRGIKIHPAWVNDFDAFLKDVGSRPQGTSLDRYPDPDGNYQPGNCRWATPAEQAANKSSK